MAELDQGDVNRLSGYVIEGNYTQFYYELYRSGSNISGLYIPGPTGQGVFGNYSHQHVISILGQEYFEANRENISRTIATHLLDAIIATKQGGSYRMLSDSEFLAAEILAFTQGLGLPTEAYPGHDLIDLTNIDVLGATEGITVYAALVRALAAIEAEITYYYSDYDGQFYTEEEAIAAGAIIEDGYLVLNGQILDPKVGGFRYKGEWFSSEDLIEQDGVLFVRTNLFSADGQFELLPVGLTTISVINLVNRIYEEGGGSMCFLAGTPINLADGSTLPIENVCDGLSVLSYDADGAIVARRVTRTFRNEVSHLLDVHGLKVTPGHVTLCGSGMFAGRHVPIIDILLSDGALVTAEGGLVRMSINKPVDSVEDRMVKVLYALTAGDARLGQLREGEMRVGTLPFDREGVPVSVLDCLKAEGLVFDPETGLVAKSGKEPEALHWYGPLPRPEDYILTRSRETLEGFLVDGEWEGSRSELIVGRLRQTAGVMN